MDALLFYQVKMAEEGTFRVDYTNKEIMEKLNELHDMSRQQKNTSEDILREAKKTNGRISKLETDVSTIKSKSHILEQLEKTSVGLWISKHPWRFAIYFTLFVTALIVLPETKEPLWNLIKHWAGV